MIVRLRCNALALAALEAVYTFSAIPD